MKKLALLLVIVVFSCNLFAQDTTCCSSINTMAALNKTEQSRKFDRYDYIQFCVGYKFLSSDVYAVTYDLDSASSFLVRAYYKVKHIRINRQGVGKARIQRKAIAVEFIDKYMGVLFTSSKFDGVLNERELEEGWGKDKNTDSNL